MKKTTLFTAVAMSVVQSTVVLADPQYPRDLNMFEQIRSGQGGALSQSVDPRGLVLTLGYSVGASIVLTKPMVKMRNTMYFATCLLSKAWWLGEAQEPGAAGGNTGDANSGSNKAAGTATSSQTTSGSAANAAHSAPLGGGGDDDGDGGQRPPAEGVKWTDANPGNKTTPASKTTGIPTQYILNIGGQFYDAVPNCGENNDCFFHAVNEGRRQQGLGPITRHDAIRTLLFRLDDQAFRNDMAMEIVNQAMLLDYQITDEAVLRNPALGRFVHTFIEYRAGRATREELMRAAAVRDVVEDYLLNHIGAPLDEHGFHPIPFLPDQMDGVAVTGTVGHLADALGVNLGIVDTRGQVLVRAALAPGLVFLLYTGGDMGHFEYLQPQVPPAIIANDVQMFGSRVGHSLFNGASAGYQPTPNEHVVLLSPSSIETSADLLFHISELLGYVGYGVRGQIVNNIVKHLTEKWSLSKTPGATMVDNLVELFEKGTTSNLLIRDFPRKIWGSAVINDEMKSDCLVLTIRMIAIADLIRLLRRDFRTSGSLSQHHGYAHSFEGMRADEAAPLRSTLYELGRAIRQESVNGMAEIYRSMHHDRAPHSPDSEVVKFEEKLPKELVSGDEAGMTRHTTISRFGKWYARHLADIFSLQQAYENVVRKGVRALPTLADKLRKTLQHYKEDKADKESKVKDCITEKMMVYQSPLARVHFDLTLWGRRLLSARLPFYLYTKHGPWFERLAQALAEVEEWGMRHAATTPAVAAPSAPARKPRHSLRKHRAQDSVASEAPTAQLAPSEKPNLDAVLDASDDEQEEAYVPGESEDDSLEEVLVDDAEPVDEDGFRPLQWRGQVLRLPTEVDYERDFLEAMRREVQYFSILKEQRAEQERTYRALLSVQRGEQERAVWERDQAINEIRQYIEAAAPVPMARLLVDRQDLVNELLTVNPRVYRLHPTAADVARLFVNLGARVDGAGGSYFDIRWGTKKIGGYEVAHENDDVRGKVKSLDGIFKALIALLRMMPQPPEGSR